MKFISNNKNKKDDHLFKNYWFNSESDTVLNKIIKENEFSFKKDFLSLLYGNVIIVEIKEILTLKKNYLKDEVWTVLLHSGYITLSDKEGYKQNIKEMDDQIIKLLLGESKLNENDVNEDLIKKYKNNQLNKHLYNNMYYIKIPNNEIFNCFIAKLKESLKNEIKDNNYLNNFINGLFNKDIDTINSNLNDYLTCLSQYHLFANEEDYENVLSSIVNANIYIL
jgi:hypothetical protein